MLNLNIYSFGSQLTFYSYSKFCLLLLLENNIKQINQNKLIQTHISSGPCKICYVLKKGNRKAGFDFHYVFIQSSPINDINKVIKTVHIFFLLFLGTTCS